MSKRGLQGRSPTPDNSPGSQARNTDTGGKTAECPVLRRRGRRSCQRYTRVDKVVMNYCLSLRDSVLSKHQ